MRRPEHLIRASCSSGQVRSVELFGESKVDDLDSSLTIKQYVFRFDVAMNDTVIMRVLESCVGVEMIAIRVMNSLWDDPKDIEELLAKEKPTTPLRIRPDGEFPCTFVIETREGGQGIMRFTKSIPEKDNQPRGQEIEYKLLRKTKPSK